MSNQDLFEDIMSVVHRTSTPRAAVSIYSVTNRNIIEVEITMESVQEGWGTPLVEYQNQQQLTT